MGAERPWVHMHGQRITFGDRFRMTVEALDLGGGDFVSIVGPSGAGKTSLLHLIGGIADVDESEGEIVRAEDLSVGFMFQGETWFEWMTVEANLRHALLLARRAPPRSEIYERIDGALSDVGLSPITFRRRILGNLSTGERRRVSLAAVLIQRPKLLLLDEPTANFDFVLKFEIQALILNIWRLAGKHSAFAVVTHDIEEAVLLGTRIVCIKDGHIVLDRKLDKPDGGLAELRKDPATLALCDEIKGLFIEIPITKKQAVDEKLPLEFVP